MQEAGLREALEAAGGQAQTDGAEHRKRAQDAAQRQC